MIKRWIFGIFALGLLFGVSEAHARECARFYIHRDFRGDSRAVSSGADVSYVGDLWNDEISSISVQPGCTFNAWEHRDFQGYHTSFSGNVKFVGSGWNDEISSYTCTCP